MVAVSGARTPQIGSVIFQLGGHHGEISVWIVYGRKRIKKVRSLSRREGRGGEGRGGEGGEGEWGEGREGRGGGIEWRDSREVDRRRGGGREGMEGKRGGKEGKEGWREGRDGGKARGMYRREGREGGVNGGGMAGVGKEENGRPQRSISTPPPHLKLLHYARPVQD